MRFSAAVAAIIAAMSATAEPASLRVVSYNIHHGEGVDGALDLERIAAILRELDADVICLQEVDRNLPRTGRRDMPAELSALLGMAVYFESNYDWEGGEYGNATLTALPVVDWENRALPNPGGAEPRGCLRTTVRVGAVEVDIFNTHLGLKSNERMEQAEAIVAGLGDRPAILAGDLNDRPGSGPIAALTAVLLDPVSPDGAQATYPAGRARARIDYILATAAWTPTAFRVVTTPAAALASDHLPIAADFVLGSPGTPSLEERGVVDAGDDRVDEALAP